MPGKMRIAYLNPTGQLGGAEKALLDLIVSVRRVEQDFEPHLIVAADGPFAVQAKKLQIPVHIVPLAYALARLGDSAAGGPAGTRTSKIKLLFRMAKATFLLTAYARRLRRTLKDLAPDLIHSNGFKMHVLGLVAAPRNTPILWHIHDYVSTRPLMKRFIKWGNKRCAAIITNSYSVGEDVRSICGPRAPIHTVHNAVDLNYFSPLGNKLDLDALSGLSPSSSEVIRIALLGTMARWKGHEVFLHALSLLPSTLPIRGYIVGGALYQTDGSQYSIDELRQRALQLGIQQKVGFTGFVDDPAAALRACDIVVHASTAPEPFGLVIAEAMACGIATIVSNAGGAKEIFTPGVNAFGVPPNNVEALAEQLLRLSQDGMLRKKIGEAARTSIADKFNHSRLAQQLIPIYRSLSIA